MVYYRLYTRNGENGPCVGSDEIRARDDVEAVRSARAFIGRRPMELWCGKRKISTFPALEREFA